MTTEQLSYLDEEARDVTTYPGRHALAVARGVVLNVYVPQTPMLLAIIDRGSAIVGLPFRRDENRVLAYFEGDRYNIGLTFAQMAQHAAGRMVARYPTVATAVVGAHQLRQVGTYDVATNALHVTDEDALDAWRNASE